VKRQSWCSHQGESSVDGSWKSKDSVEPYLRQILSFIGIEDVQTVRAEDMNMPPLAVDAVPNGEKTVEALVI
jgi:FMN-dependent NADH-azoreductase